MDSDEAAAERENQAPIDVLIAGSADDPRTAASIPGVALHRGPPMHPDDVTTLNGLRITSPSRTLIDCAEFVTATELRAAFARARELGLLDPEAIRAARARVEWRPSLAMLDEVIDEFCGGRARRRWGRRTRISRLNNLLGSPT